MPVLRNGLSLNQAAERMSVSPTTAFRWRHRFLALPKGLKAQALVGIAEADETFFLESHKSRRGLTRPPCQRGGKAAEHVTAVLAPILNKDTILCTDGSRTLAAVAKMIGMTHRPVSLAAGRRVIAGVYHVQHVNAYDSHLKGWMRRFKGVRTSYLVSYLSWYRALNRATGGLLNPALLLAQAVGSGLLTTQR